MASPQLDLLDPRLSESADEVLSDAGGFTEATMDDKTRCFDADLGSGAIETPLPSSGMNVDPVDPRVASEMIRRYLSIEGNATQNLATFCQTYMEPEAAALMAENLDKNAIDKDEYPMTADLENRCVRIIESLWNADQREKPMGTSTVGSSEACMLGGLSMLFRWKRLATEADLELGKVRPNLVISAGYQVCWEKFCRYWDIEMRLVPLDKEHLSLNTDTVMDYVDAYTIGIVAILGITYTGRYDDIAILDTLVQDYNQAHRELPVRIHVDAASGGMFAPFVEPDLKWDFRCRNVWSINTSGHKYGLVYPGIGWAVWRSEEALPRELVFSVSYLGGEEETMAINFSRSAAQIVGQYYLFLRNGLRGFTEIHKRTLDIARYLAAEISKIGFFEVLEDAKNIPIVCWTLQEDAQVAWSLYDLAERLRLSGWLVPAYPMPEDLEDMDVQRLVVRQDFSMSLALRLIDDLHREIGVLQDGHVIIGAARRGATTAFNHGGRSVTKDE